MKHLLTIFLLTLLFGSCVHHKFAYKKVCKKNDITAYENFVKKYPKSKYVTNCEDKLLSLYEDKEYWAIFANLHSYIYKPETEFKIRGCEMFIIKYPNSQYLPKVTKCLAILNEQRAWTFLSARKTLDGYKEYLIKYPKGDHTTQALTRIEEIERKMWDDVDSKNTLEGYYGFLKVFPKSEKAFEIEKKIWVLTDKKNTLEGYKDFQKIFPKSEKVLLKIAESMAIQQKWEQAVERNTIEGFDDFMDKYPNSVFAQEVNSKYQLIYEKEWSIAPNTIEGYLKYKARFPRSPYNSRADENVRTLEEASSWLTAKERNTISAYRQFLNVYPDGYYTLGATRAIDQLKSMEENAFWERASRANNSVKAYQQYIETYPNGTYVAKAKKYIIDIEVNDILKGEHGEMPKMQKNYSSSGYSSSSTTSNIEIENNTEYTLTVRYSGSQESRKVVLETRQKQTITILNGTYNIAASVNARNVRNYAGTDSVSGGNYTSSFYIKTETYYNR